MFEISEENGIWLDWLPDVHVSSEGNMLQLTINGANERVTTASSGRLDSLNTILEVV